MKVLMFGWEFPPYNSGGLGVACLGLTRALSRIGINLTFVLPKRLGEYGASTRLVFGDDYYESLGLSAVSFHEIDSLLYPYVDSAGYTEEMRLTMKKKGLPYARTLIDEVRRYGIVGASIAKRESFDVIHAHDWLSFLAGIEAKRATGKPLIVHVHATEFDRGGGGGVNQHVYDIERRGMHEADRVITVSQWTKSVVVERYGVPADKVSVVHNGIDEVDYIRPHGMPSEILSLKRGGSKIVLFLGRVTIQKGPDYFVRMARRVLDYYKNVYFVVTGSGDMERQMIEEAVRHGMSDRFIFTGFLRGEESAAMYAAADLFVMPSVSEPFGITPLESYMNGTPVLISKQSGAAEVLTHALKCDFWDVDEMANQVVSVLEHPELHKTLAENGHSQTRTIDWDKAARKCANIYDDVTG